MANGMEVLIEKLGIGPGIPKNIYNDLVHNDRYSLNQIKRPHLDGTLQKKLRDYLKNDVVRLRRFTGDDFEGWCL